MSEKDIQDQIIQALQHFKIFKTFVWRNNTGVAKYNNRDGSSRFIRYGYPGSADITGICYGRRLDIEVKQPGGKQSEKQREYENTVKANGGIYFVATSVDEAINRLQDEIRLMQKTGWTEILEKL